MPQLMPMFWVFSVFMMLMLVIMLLEMYYNSDVEMFQFGSLDENMDINMYMW